MMGGEAKCPFCRVPAPTSNDEIRDRTMKRTEMDDANAIYSLGCYYANGECGVPQNYDKALDHWHRAVNLVVLNHITILVVLMIVAKVLNMIRRKLSITGS